MKFVLTGGEVHDSTQAEVLLENQEASRVLADRAYVGKEIRAAIIAIGAIPVIPSKKNAVIVHPYSRKIYKERNVIERMINKMKNFRRIATRFEKNAINFLAMVQLCASLLWLR